MAQYNYDNKLKKHIFVTFIYTFLALLVIFFEIMLAMLVLCPNESINMYEYLGLEKAKLGALEIKYNKTNSATDLYNLIIEAEKQENYKKTDKYVDIMLKRDDFFAFAKALDDYALSISDKDKLYLVASLESYLYSLKVTSCYKKNIEQSLEMASSCFEKNSLSIFYFSRFVDLIKADNNLSSDEKISWLKKAGSFIVNSKTILTHIDELYKNNYPTDIENAKLLILEQLWHLKGIERILLQAQNVDLTEIDAQLNQLAEIISKKLA